MENGTKIVDYKKVPLLSYRMVVGRLACNNILTDRQCSNPGCKQICQSAKHAKCPKCDSVLDWLRTTEGVPYCVSEGTYYPIMYKAARKRWESTIAKSRKLALPEYRFKLYSRMADNGLLQLPENHQNMMKGAVVELIQRNQAAYYHSFDRPKRTDGKNGVEELLKLDPRYGDSVRVITGEELNRLLNQDVPDEARALPTAAAVLPPPGSTLPALPINTPPVNAPPANPDIAAVMKRIADLEKIVAGGQTPPVAAQAVSMPGNAYTEDDDFGY